jgi:P27 family predicted phage terminase small subunit
MFSQRKMPDLPRGTPQDLRKRAKDLLKTNTHLWSSDQVPSVIRLVRLHKHFETASEQLEQTGLLVETQKGDAKPNPLIGIMTTLSGKILSLERALGITFSARNNNVKESEKKVGEAPAHRAQGSKPKLVKMA